MRRRRLFFYETAVFYFQKFSDFLRARTQNVHLTVLYYGQMFFYETAVFYFQKFSDFLRARTQNVHLTVLYYGQSTKIRGVDNGNFRRTERIKSC